LGAIKKKEALVTEDAKEMPTRKSSASTESGSDQHRIMDLKQVRTHPTFVDLLPISEDLKASLVRSTRANGYYESEPIVLATWPGQDEPVLIDGHARRAAALDVGITAVPAVQVRSESDLAVLHLAINLQTVRRRSTDGAYYRLCCQYDRLMERGGDRRSEGAKSMPTRVGIDRGRNASARRTAAIIGCNYKKVDKIRKIRRDGTPEIQEDVKDDRMSINKAYKLIRDMEIGEDEEKSRRKLSAAQIKAVKAVLSEDNLIGLEALADDLGSLLNQAVEQFISSQGDKGHDEPCEAGTSRDLSVPRSPR